MNLKKKQLFIKRGNVSESEDRYPVEDLGQTRAKDMRNDLLPYILLIITP